MKLTSFLLAALLPAYALSQTSGIRQIATMPVQLNPAFAGLVPGDFRGSVSYHSYTPGHGTPVFQTINTGLDMSLLKGKLPAGDAVGLGIHYCYDEVGGVRFKSTPMLTAAYHKAIGKTNAHRISVGGQAIYSTYTYPDATNTQAGRSSTSAAAGILYSGSFGSRLAIFAGYTYTSIGPKAFNRNDPAIPAQAPLQLICGGMAWRASHSVSVFGNVRYFIRYPYTLLAYSAYSRLSLSSSGKRADVAIWGGAILVDRALSPYVGLEAGHVRLAGSFNVSQTSPTTQPFELSLLYTVKLNRTRAWNTQVLF